MKQFNTFNYYFTDSSFRIQHENSTETSKIESPNPKTVPGANQNVQEPVSKQNTDKIGGEKEKATIDETDISRGNLYSK